MQQKMLDIEVVEFSRKLNLSAFFISLCLWKITLIGVYAQEYQGSLCEGKGKRCNTFIVTPSTNDYFST